MVVTEAYPSPLKGRDVDDIKMVDFVIYALEESDKKTQGREVPGSAVKLFRLPELMRERKMGRCGGPWEDARMGLGCRYRWRMVPGVKGNRAPHKILEPVVVNRVKIAQKDGTEVEREFTTTLQPDSCPVKVDQTSGTLWGSAVEAYPAFSAENAKYLETICMFHFRNGTLDFLSDETSDSVYINELPRLAKLIGKKVFWEFRPYIKTAAGAASGVDSLKLAIVGADDDEMVK